MALTANATSLRLALNGASPGQLPDMLRTMAFGDMMRQSLPCALRNQNVDTAANDPPPYQIATLASLQLPDSCKAHTILRAYARAGTGTKGELTVSAYGVTPTATHVAVAPNGDLVFLEADEYTNVDVVYMPEKCDVVELVLPVVPGTGVCALPAAITKIGVVLLMEAQQLVGTVTTTAGGTAILIPGGTPATTQAALDLAKANVQFLIADAVSSCRLKLGLVSAVDVNALLEGSSALLP
jgi:hypothetical protein